MAYYDIFNGDADGICALHQLRLAEPRDSVLVTGVKREIALVGRVHASPGDALTILDVSLAVNRAALLGALDAGARCVYFDHHDAAGDVPVHPRLEAHIDTAPSLCTSLIVDRYLAGRFRAWAVVAAFGDNLSGSAHEAAQALGLRSDELALLRELGECMNYNAYGDEVEDLHFHPAQLYRRLQPYHDPRQFAAQDPAFETLRSGYLDDLARANEIAPELSTPSHYLLSLPDTRWARRVHGALANKLARAHAQRAHAVLARRGETYRVSVRAPAARPLGAARLCSLFATGGGRSEAAGIDVLPAAQLPRFREAFESAFGPSATAL